MPKKHVCRNCGINITDNKINYCSQKCFKNTQKANSIQGWKNKEISGHNSHLSLKLFVRKYMLEKFNNKCYKCGWGEINPYSGKYSLIVDHIDGDSENSWEDNLRVVCPNCDSLSPTYKALNKGNGRASRRERYSLGKSF